MVRGYQSLECRYDIRRAKFTKLFLFGNCSFDTLTQTAAQIRAFKRPEPYKGKGILHDQEKIILKKGKKI